MIDFILGALFTSIIYVLYHIWFVYNVYKSLEKAKEK